MAIFSGPRIVESGLIAHWDASNMKSYPGTGTTWFDVSGQGVNTTLVNGTSYNSTNKTMVFDGVNDRCSSVTLPNPLGQLTCEVVMQYLPAAEYHNIFDRIVATPMFWIRPSSQFNRIELNTGNGLVSSVGYENQIIVATAMYRSDASPGLQLYINGNLVNTNNTIQSAWPNPFTITLFNRGGAQTYRGSIYSLKFYNRVLTANEVRQNFEAIRSRYGI